MKTYTKEELFAWMMEQPGERKVNMATPFSNEASCGCLMSEFLKDKGHKDFYMDTNGCAFTMEHYRSNEFLCFPYLEEDKNKTAEIEGLDRSVFNHFRKINMRDQTFSALKEKFIKK